MGNIVLLDELTINKIAAGEVIERPASVVKEMLENSIDAGAKHVTVEIKNGGISFIRITDDGKGIARDDVEMAFERHATSKIRSAEDLDTVKSMGFRGEALASIAAIANVELISRTNESDIGTKAIVEGGDIQSVEETGCSVGTTITVRNLFFNTPVRYKFLKKDFTESGYIEDVVTRIALVHPEVALKFVNTGRIIIQTNGNNNITETIYAIFGKEVANNLINVDYEYEYIKIKGVIGKPNIARSNRSNQIFFVNNRYIKDKTLSSAVEQAFKGMLPIGKFAFLVLNLEMPPEKVDVNVHPAKLEVRFEDENIAFKSMFHAIKDSLLKEDFMTDRERTNQIKEASKDAFKISDYEAIAENTYVLKNDEESKKEEKIDEKTQKIDIIQDTEPTQKIEIKFAENDQLKNTTEEKENQESNQEIIEKLKAFKEEIKQENENILKEKSESEEKAQSEEKENSEPQEQTETKQEYLEETDNIETKTQEKENNSDVESKTNDISFEKMYKELFGKEPYGGRKQTETVKKEEENFYKLDDNIEEKNVSMFEDNVDYKKIAYKFLGIAFNTYIILEIENELYIMDQHAAHERIMYEKVKKNFYKEEEKASQMLLLPDVITLTHKEMDIAKDNLDLFKKTGFVLEEFGENTIKLSGVPDICVDLNTEELFKETLDEINTVARTSKQEKEEKFIATIACKAAVKANMVLTKEEVDSLMEKLLELPNPFTCPHGRPTVIKISKYEIERKFARK